MKELTVYCPLKCIYYSRNKQQQIAKRQQLQAALQ